MQDKWEFGWRCDRVGEQKILFEFILVRKASLIMYGNYSGKIGYFLALRTERKNNTDSVNTQTSVRKYPSHLDSLCANISPFLVGGSLSCPT